MNLKGPNEPWRKLAACREMDKNLFFPQKEGAEFGDHRWVYYSTEARDACRRCPVRAACLDYALTHKEKFGLWGGLTPTERKNLRRGLKSASSGVE